MEYKIFCDGATSANGQVGAVGGWAFTIYDEDENAMEGYGAEYDTTNNRMEMTAIIEALKVIETLKLGYKEKTIYTIYSDSAYCINCIAQCWYKTWQANGWVNSKKEPVKNKDLWEKLIPYFEDTRFTFVKVKGHDGNPGNERVDELAKLAIRELREEDK